MYVFCIMIKLKKIKLVENLEWIKYTTYQILPIIINNGKTDADAIINNTKKFCLLFLSS